VSKVGTVVVQVYREARRRKVFRTAALYVVGAWLALQVANVVFPGFAVPDAAIRALVWAAVAGCLRSGPAASAAPCRSTPLTLTSHLRSPAATI